MNPNAPAMEANSTLSIRSCRTTRQRVAPSAVRTLISRERRPDRARSRLLTLAHAISSTHDTAPNSDRNIGWVAVPVYGRTAARKFRFVAGYSRASRSVRAASSACACDIEMPSTRRPPARNWRRSRLSRWSPDIAETGSQRSSTSGNRNPRGMTPMIVARVLFTRIVLPTIDGSLP